MRLDHLLLAPLLLLSVTATAAAQGRSGALREAFGDDQISDRWIYEDIATGYALAKQTGKPLLVAFR